MSITTALKGALDKATNGFVDVVVQYDYNNKESKRLVGFSFNGFSTERIDPRESFWFTYEQFSSALIANNVGLAKMPEKMPSGDQQLYAYRVSANWKVNLSVSIWESKSVTPQMIEREKAIDMWEKRFGAPPSPADLVAMFGS